MASRLKLHEELCEILGSLNVYFQPPESAKIKYSCIKYSLVGIDQKYAGNKLYNTRNRYEVIVMDFDPDSDIPAKIMNHFEMCSFDRWYAADKINHFVLTLYY